jgi:hypothetical protein
LWAVVITGKTPEADAKGGAALAVGAGDTTDPAAVAAAVAARVLMGATVAMAAGAVVVGATCAVGTGGGVADGVNEGTGIDVDVGASVAGTAVDGAGVGSTIVAVGGRSVA